MTDNSEGLVSTPERGAAPGSEEPPGQASGPASPAGAADSASLAPIKVTEVKLDKETKKYTALTERGFDINEFADYEDFDEAALQVHPTEAYGQAAAGHLRRSVRKGSQGSGSEDDVRGSPLLEAQAGCRAGAG